MENQTMSEVVYLRMTPEMKAMLETIASQSVARNISDHIRFAVQRYIDSVMTEWSEEREGVAA